MHSAQLAGFRSELDHIRMEKKAIFDPVSLGLLGTGMHMTANLGYKGLRATGAGHRFEAGQVASGYRHGMAGKRINPIIKNVATFGLGPESLVNYDIGRHLGQEASTLSKGRRYRELKKLRKNVAMSNSVREAPIGRSVVPAVNRILSGEKGIMDRLPTVAAGAKSTLGQRAVSAGVGAAAAAAAPDSLIHMGINATRNALGKGRIGKKFMDDQFNRGLSSGPIGKLKSHLTDILVSPAALDTRRLGAAIQQDSLTNPGRSARLAQSLTHQTSQVPGGREFLRRQVARPEVQKVMQHPIGQSIAKSPRLKHLLEKIKRV